MTATKTKPYVFEGSGSAIDDYHKPKPTTDNSQPTTQKNWGTFDKKNKQHLSLLSQLRTLQWVKKSEKWGEVADLDRLSDFLKSDKSPVKKPLKDMDKTEVTKIIECFKSMVRKMYG